MNNTVTTPTRVTTTSIIQMTKVTQKNHDVIILNDDQGSNMNHITNSIRNSVSTTTKLHDDHWKANHKERLCSKQKQQQQNQNNHMNKYMIYFEQLIEKNMIESQILHAYNYVTNNCAHQNVIPKVDEKELLVGRILGCGSFCCVQEVNIKTTTKSNQSDANNTSSCKSFSHLYNNIRSHDNDNASTRSCRSSSITRSSFSIGIRRHSDNHVHRVPQFTSNNNDQKKHHCRQRNRYDLFPYAIKRLKPSSVHNNDDDENSYKKYQALYDFYMEVQYLSVLHHPTIISVIATSPSYSNRLNDTSFVILDKLNHTLLYRINIIWKLNTYHNPKHNQIGIKRLLFDPHGHKEYQCFIERLQYAYDIANAIQYLHEKNIMYRDLKPENIGFDCSSNDTIKIFDFGLAREFYPNQCTNVLNGISYYHYTQGTGSYYYMDPYIGNGSPYNELCDVYSFCILLWQMIELDVPYYGYTLRSLRKKVWISNQYLRPILENKHWTSFLKDMIHQGWSYDYTKRPTMKSICHTLEDIILNHNETDQNHHHDHSHKNSYDSDLLYPKDDKINTNNCNSNNNKNVNKIRTSHRMRSPRNVPSWVKRMKRSISQ